MPREAPYGTWTSPVSAADVAAHDGRPNWVDFVGDEVWWTEPAPAQGGRIRLLRHRGTGEPVDVLPAPWNVRNRSIEYGGKPWTAVPGPHGPVLVFTEWSDQRLYRYEPDRPDQPPAPVTPEPDRPAGLRYGEPFIHPERDEVWCVREVFHGDAPTDVHRAIVAIPLSGEGSARVLVESHHFLTNPRLSPDGRHLSWIGWNHPDMPWDATRLCVAALDPAGTPGPVRVMAGGPGVSVVQAEWLDADTLAYVSDADGWWHPWTATVDGAEPVRLAGGDEEFAGALWQLGACWFAPVDPSPGGPPGGGRPIAAIHGRAATRLSVFDLSGGRRDIGVGYTEWTSTIAARGTSIAAIAASPERPYDVVRLDADSGAVTVLRPGSSTVDPAYLPEPVSRTFTGSDGRDIHAHLYPPRNPDFTGPPAERPPYVVFVHGGPTGRCLMIYNLEIAYFTSRGIGVVEVNYGGSTGHGRAYRERLREAWGVVDVVDCAEVARALVAEGTADEDRLAIRGGSAGGWTTAASLVAVDVYRCGTIQYPVLDLAGFVAETHDFESRYLDGLIGPWPATADRYRERSPIEHVDAITVPFVLMQGLEDAICPPAQSERFLERVKGRGIPHAYLAFPGEQHGFRKAENISTALAAELSFYGQILGFDPPGVPRLELTS
jgi:dipeptidyl aminopeptidase/acylaminoacyl peptidase